MSPDGPYAGTTAADAHAVAAPPSGRRRVVITAVARTTDGRPELVPASTSITVAQSAVDGLLPDRGEFAGPIEPSALLKPLSTRLGRARGRDSADLVALVRLVLAADDPH